MPDTTRTPDDIERDIERERSELGRTVNELQDRFSPDHIFREIGRGLSDHGSDIGEAVTRSVKRNPVALALTGVGLAWLMSGRSWDEDAQRVFPNGNGRKAEARYDAARPVPAGTRPAHPEAMRTHGPGGALDDPSFVPPAGAGTAADTNGHFGARRGDDWLYADDDHFWDDLDEDDHDDEPGFGTRAASNLRGMADQAGDGVSSAADSVGEGAAQAREQAASGLQGVRDGINDAAERTRDGLSSARHSTAARARRIRRRLAHGTEDMAEAARERVIAARWSAVKARRAAARRARHGADRAQEFYDQNPLVVGGLALAAGAILAGALPRTRQEDDWFGASSDRYYDKAERIYESERDKALRVADRAADTAREVLEEERRKIDDQAPGEKSAAEHIADEVRSGVSEVAEAGRDEAERQKLGDPKS